MKRKIIFIVFVFVGGVFPLSADADFTAGNLFVVNEPSSGSAGDDFVVELDPEGTFLDTLIPQSQEILGMRRLAFDRLSGHLFYSVSNWSPPTFEIREVDSSGVLLETYTPASFGSGNISMVFDRGGNLHIANDGSIFFKAAGSLNIVKLFEIPYTGIGDLEIDSAGNLYLSDPFVNDTVYKIFPDGTTVPFADSTDGIDNPYGLAMDANNNLYVANSVNGNASIVKVDPSGQVSLFTNVNVNAGILDMAFDENQTLYVSNRSDETIHTFDSSGTATLIADADDGLDDPSSMAFIIFKAPCTSDMDVDGDVDGADLAEFANDFDAGCLVVFCQQFGIQGL